MRILFFEDSPVWNYLLPEGFVDAGHQVKVTGPLAQHNIPKVIEEFRPHLIVTMGWGIFQWESYQNWLKQYIHASGIPHVFWSLEDPEHTHTFTLPLLRRVQPNFVFTICKSKVQYFQQLGFPTAHMDYAYNPRIHYRTDIMPKYHCSIAVVANAYDYILKNNPSAYRTKSIQTLICPLLENNIRVDFWGNNWADMKPILGYDIPASWIHGYLPYLEANQVYSSADIVIGLQNNYMQLTQRTYEILSSGGFLLTPDTMAIRERFRPGQDLIASSSPQETMALVDYYLKRPEERERIRNQGRLTVKDHTYKHRAQYMIHILQSRGILK
ncbi:CgeB family protein [Thermotalea metallivorans]|uniref:Spore protein YkvP n=1 Tax=Thermotalea metallivorans TaxID=520762 RepID=A0A140L4H9_9FIRM|nr:glycosyltransferase [Thermotalea metallivorans]KXG75454.1 Spore protein YkvP [Thermotalea metallivorans]